MIKKKEIRILKGQKKHIKKSQESEDLSRKKEIDVFGEEVKTKHGIGSQSSSRREDQRAHYPLSCAINDKRKGINVLLNGP